MKQIFLYRNLYRTNIFTCQARKTKNTLVGSSFSDVWQRITKETDIKFHKDLGELVGVTQQNVSIRKKENLFPYGWAYPVAHKYHLLTEWILTGEGPKRLDELKSDKCYDFKILNELEEWLSELVVKEPYRKEWFLASIEDCFPMFKEWKKRKDEEENEDTIFPSKKTA